MKININTHIRLRKRYLYITLAIFYRVLRDHISDMAKRSLLLNKKTFILIEKKVLYGLIPSKITKLLTPKWRKLNPTLASQLQTSHWVKGTKTRLPEWIASIAEFIILHHLTNHLIRIQIKLVIGAFKVFHIITHILIANRL